MLNSDQRFIPQHYPVWAITADDMNYHAPRCKSAEELATALRFADMAMGPQPVIGWVETEHDPLAMLGHSGFTDRIAVLESSPERAIETAAERWEGFGGKPGQEDGSAK